MHEVFPTATNNVVDPPKLSGSVALRFRVVVKPLCPIVLLFCSSSSHSVAEGHSSCTSSWRMPSLHWRFLHLSVPSWKVVGSRFVDVFQLGVRSLNVSVSLLVLCFVVELAYCLVSRYLGGLLVITSNLYH